jgi:putative membrane protein
MSAETSSSDPRVYLAAERTFLAWIRTGLALMAFGFVVARFGLFLRELEASRGAVTVEPSALSLPLGIGLVLLGVAVNIFAAWQHVRYVNGLKQGALMAAKPSTLAIVLAVVLAIAGVTMAFYLGTTKANAPAPRSALEAPVP